MKKKANILLVDDDQVDIAKIKRALQTIDLAYTLHITNDGVEALKFLRDSDTPRPNIILLDLNMPKMSGLEFLETLRAEPQLRAIPVVVLTSSDEPDDKKKAFASHVAGYLMKPVDEERFVEMIQTFSHYWIMNQLPQS